MRGAQGGGGKRKHETQPVREGEPGRETEARGAVQACLLYLLVTEREREGERGSS